MRAKVTDGGAFHLDELLPRPLLVVPDANVFTGYEWTEQLLTETQQGRIQLFWSPKIVEEMGRVRFWIWVKRTFQRNQSPTGSAGWKALWSRYSEEAHAWFDRVSPHLQVIDDRAPHEDAWVVSMPDPNDAWLWNTARRVHADFVVTVNLKDGPPTNAEGLRRHEQTIYVHPDVFTIVLRAWAYVCAAGAIPPDLSQVIRDTGRQQRASNIHLAEIHLRAILARMANESPPPQR